MISFIGVLDLYHLTLILDDLTLAMIPSQPNPNLVLASSDIEPLEIEHKPAVQLCCWTIRDIKCSDACASSVEVLDVLYRWYVCKVLVVTDIEVIDGVVFGQ